MRIRIPFIIVMALALTIVAMHAQIADPIQAPVEKRGLMVEIRDVVRLPQTRGMRPIEQDVNPSGWARVQFVRDLPDGRRFANDSRGFFYLLDKNNQPSVYANVAEAFPFAIYNRLESGFIGFDFHPEFAKNGLFYTVHGERAMGNPATPNFIPPGFTAKDVTHHNVITEWRAKSPAANTFDGTRRELLRVAHVVMNLTHPMGNVEFNPTAKPGSARLRPALHQRQRLRLQQRRRAERQQSRPDAAARFSHHRHPPLRSAQPLRNQGREGTRRLHDPDGQQVRGRRRSEDAR